MSDEIRPIHRGKVRDIYEVDQDRLLMITSDRISAFDVVMHEPIPGKGRVLTAFTDFWLGQFSDLVDGHLLSTDIEEIRAEAPELVDALGPETALAGRSMLVKRAEMLSVECIVRGYLAGSAFKEYKQSQTMHSMPLPAGMLESDKLPEPVFTPSTKAEIGDHDENITEEQAASILGSEIFERAKNLSLEIYTRASEMAATRGVIIADTKFEFGIFDDTLILCDEVLTPDSSRFWPAQSYEPGRSQVSFDKQPLRDWLEASGWAKTPPPPRLPADVVEVTAQRYAAAYNLVTGLDLQDWPGSSR